jgi:hypothetical protein
METMEVKPEDLRGLLVETRADSNEYHPTDCQVSCTTSEPHRFMSGTGYAQTFNERAINE